MPRVKVCGLTNLDDARAALDAGADALGFVFAPSPRRVDSETVRGILRDVGPLVFSVGVFVDEALEEVRRVRDVCGLSAVQLSGREDEAYARALGGRVIKTIHLSPDFPDPDPAAFPEADLLVDSGTKTQAGGTGRVFDWTRAVCLARKRPVILAGGLTPENVAQAIQTVKPQAVDVASGVEKEKGRKDHERLRLFVRAVRAAG
jgi:phosphoribosylanthranilate isomerase